MGALSALIAPSVLVLLLNPLSGGFLNYLPAGPTAIVFASLAQYHAMVPRTYQYRVTTSSTVETDDPSKGLSLSDKSYRYALALHLAFLQWPGSLLGATVGWVLGYMWRIELLPQSLIQWRVPGWLVGEDGKSNKARFETFKRRLEAENSSTGIARGFQGPADGQRVRRRALGQQILEQF